MCKFNFMDDATNVYRTKHYIVKQCITIQKDSVLGNSVISHDTYYKRTMFRDKKYEYAFRNKIFVDGKRMPSTAYTRKYID